jgi:hypothetical protein
MEPERILAMLWHYTEGAIDLDWWWHHGHNWFVTNVIFRPSGRDDKEPYWPKDRKLNDAKPIGPVSLFMRTTGAAMKKQGATREEIQERMKQWLKSYQGVDFS